MTDLEEFSREKEFMGEALRLARKAFQADEVPVGAVVVRAGRIIARAYNQVELKNLIDGRKNNVRFRSAETVERVRLDTKDFQFLYHDGDMLVFMDQENYEQISLPEDLLGDAAAFLQDGMPVKLDMYNERPISVELPDQIEATIVEADAVVKGQTASSSYKPAVLDNGVKVLVPPHITSGTRIVVDPYSREYVRRAD